MAKTEQLQIRVSRKEKARIQARAAAAGEDVSKWVLRRLLPPDEERFQSLCKALASKRGDLSYALAEMHDFLAGLSAAAINDALRSSPQAALGQFEANYLAAMIEHTCVGKAAVVPAWVYDIESLPAPWFASGIKNLRLYLLVNSPPAFRSRNLFVDSSVGERV